MILEYNLDKYNVNYNFVKNVKEGDTLTLKCNIYEKGQVKDLSGYSADLRWVNSNNTFVNIAGSKVTIVGSIVTIQCDDNCTKAPGTCKFELHLHSSLEEDYSFTQKVDVYESVFQGQLAYKNVSTILDDLNEANKNAEQFVKDYGNLYGIKYKVDELNNTKAEKKELDTVNSRIDSFTHLAEGSTTGDAELIDGRIGFNGKRYDNIGEAIRKQISSLNEDLETLKPLNYTIGQLRFSTSDNKTFTFSDNSGYPQIYFDIPYENKKTLLIDLDMTWVMENDVDLKIAFYKDKYNLIGNSEGYKFKTIEKTAGITNYKQKMTIDMSSYDDVDLSSVSFIRILFVYVEKGLSTDGKYVRINNANFYKNGTLLFDINSTLTTHENEIERLVSANQINNLKDRLNNNANKTHKKIVTWIDDDTFKEGIPKVKTICDTLGIKATFACMTQRLEDNSLIELLKNYQNEGYHITTHTNVHTTWYRVDGDKPLLTIQECEEDLMKSLTLLRENGFLDSDMLVYPGSSPKRNGIHEIAKRWCKCGVLAEGKPNVYAGKGLYDISRTFINKNQNLSFYTSLIDEYNTDTGAWIVFGTHSGNTNEFDSELVTNVMRYCIDNGFEFMTLNEALRYREKFYTIQDIFE